MYRCWKVLLVHFREGGRTKYAWEALQLLFQLQQLSPSASHQLKWGRFIDAKGGLGRNIPCDLHNEHINRTIPYLLTVHAHSPSTSGYAASFFGFSSSLTSILGADFLRHYNLLVNMTHNRLST